MSQRRFPHASIELLESRIAPALFVYHPAPDLTVGPGKTGADIDLSRIFDPSVKDNGHTILTLQTNLDADPNTPGIQPSAPIVIELFDDTTPLTVQNFLSYFTNPDTATNYKNTFFHRSVPGFVVQGGGFNVTTPDTHIPTVFDVHNEFSATRSNLLGTLAMAKSVGPNTANSEWFFNLANNSSNLDNQNGGFTVFAKVIQGFDVVQKIAALKTFNFSGSTNGSVVSVGSLNTAFTDFPLQNYNADPDSNPATPAPTPTSQNVVSVSGYSITLPSHGTLSGGISFSFDVVDATTSLASDLVTGTLNGTNLHLDYKPGGAGVVKVTVHGSDGSSSAADDFAINLQPNLVSNFAGDPFQSIIVGGDATQGYIVVGNNGGGWATGAVDVKVYLSKRDAQDTNGVLVQPDRDVLIASFLNEQVDVAPGKTATLLKSLQIPQQLVVGSDVYKVLVQVLPSTGSAIKERFSDDSVAFNSKPHIWLNGFGTISDSRIGQRTDAVLTYVEADGDMVKISMTGKGGGQVNFDGTLADLVVSDSGLDSVVKAKVVSDATVGQRDIDLHNVELAGFVRSLMFHDVSLTGSFSASRSFGDLDLGKVTGGGLMTIGKSPLPVTGRPTIEFQSVSDFNIDSFVRIKSLRAGSWLDGGGAKDRITARAITALKIAGDFEADVALLNAESLDVFRVSGFVRNSRITTDGNVGAISVGGLDHTDILIGASGRPFDASGFSANATLDSLTVSGVSGGAKSFLDSNVVASRIGGVVVNGVAGSSGSTHFGIVAEAIKSYNRDGVFVSTDLNTPTIADKFGKYLVSIV